MLDLSRDKRTIITALVLPIVTFPLLFGLGGYFANPTSNPPPVLVVNMDHGNSSSIVTNALLRTPGISITSGTKTNVTGVVQSGQYDAGIVIPPDFTQKLNSGGQVNITLVYDATNTKALQAISIIQGVTGSISQQIASQRLAAKGVTKSDLIPIGLTTSTVRKLTNPSLIFFSDLFPTFLLYFTFLGGFYFVVDDIAGEKERRSLEALFTLPPKRSTIFFGKFVAAFTLSMITAALGLVGTFLSLRNSTFTGGGSISVDPLLFIQIFALTALAGLALTALGFCISAFAKNIREAQQYLSPIFFIIFIPLYFVFDFSPSRLSQFASIPLLGITILMRDIIISRVTLFEVTFSLAVNVLTFVFFTWLAVRLLHSEKIILRAS
jgi:sodium transport system permease protein